MLVVSLKTVSGGFVSRFPVILSIENHCSIQQQKKIAQYLKEIFGDKLDLSSVATGDSRQLPSPQNLKGKVLVKVTCYWRHVQNATQVSMWRWLGIFFGSGEPVQQYHVEQSRGGELESSALQRR